MNLATSHGSASASRGVLISVGVLVFGQMLYVGVLIKICHHELLRWVILGAPAFSACMTSYLAPNRKFLMGTSITFYGVAIGMLSAMLYRGFGFNIDNIGGFFWGFTVIFIYYGVLSLVGSVAGMIVFRKFQMQSE